MVSNGTMQPSHGPSGRDRPLFPIVHYVFPEDGTEDYHVEHPAETVQEGGEEAPLAELLRTFATQLESRIIQPRLDNGRTRTKEVVCKAEPTVNGATVAHSTTGARPKDCAQFSTGLATTAVQCVPQNVGEHDQAGIPPQMNALFQAMQTAVVQNGLQPNEQMQLALAMQAAAAAGDGGCHIPFNDEQMQFAQAIQAAVAEGEYQAPVTVDQIQMCNQFAQAIQAAAAEGEWQSSVNIDQIQKADQGIKCLNTFMTRANEAFTGGKLPEATNLVKQGLSMYDKQSLQSYHWARVFAAELHSINGRILLEKGCALPATRECNEALLMSHVSSREVLADKAFCANHLKVWLSLGNNCNDNMEEVLEYIDDAEEIAIHQDMRPGRAQLFTEAFMLAECVWKNQPGRMTYQRIRCLATRAGETWMALGAHPDVVQECVDKALEYEGDDDFDTLKLAAMVFVKRGHLAEGKCHMDKALRMHPEDRDLAWLGPYLETQVLAEGRELRRPPDLADDQDLKNIWTEFQKQQEGWRIKQENARQCHKGESEKRRRNQKMKPIPREKPKVEINQKKTAISTPVPRTIPDASSKSQTEHEVERQVECLPYTPDSMDTLCHLLETHDVGLACDDCWARNGTSDNFEPWCAAAHSKSQPCSRSVVLFRPKRAGREWQRVTMQASNDRLKEPSNLQSTQRPKSSRRGCPFPHNDCEKDLWNSIDNLDELQRELSTTHLLSDGILKFNMSKYEGYFKVFCEDCYLEDNTTFTGKQNHLCFVNDHTWVPERTGLCFVQERDGDQPVTCLEKFSRQLDSPIFNDVRSFIDQLEGYGFSREDVERKSTQLKREVNAILRAAPREITNEEAEDKRLIVLDEIELQKMLNKEDTYRYTPAAPRDDDEEAHYACSDSPYYQNPSRSDLIRLLKDKPAEYIRCIIRLNGPHESTCVPVSPSDGPAIDIRGRVNCGTAFDGDEVVMRKMKVKELDRPGEVTRGTVVGVLERRTERGAYTYVCTVGYYSANLMQPICGRAPKMHIHDAILSERGLKKEDCIACYDCKLRPRKIYKLTQFARENFLFLVQYLKWDPSKMYPLGYVAKVIPVGSTPDNSQRVLDLVYQVNTYNDYNPEQLADDFILADHEDKRSIQTMSIDPEGCKDADDALSVEKVDCSSGEDVYEVGVHIADVTHFVKKDDAIDQEAKRRVCSFYPVHGNVHHMLPSLLSEDTCSLLQGKDRVALSVFIRMNVRGEVMKDEPVVKRTVIRNYRQLTYQETQSIIDNYRSSEECDVWQRNVYLLYKLSKAVRKRRLDRAQYFYGDNLDNLDAHILVEEFMILANGHIAQLIEKTFPGCALLRTQQPPSKLDVNGWLREYQDIVPYSFYFGQFKELNEKRKQVDGTRSITHIPITLPSLNQLEQALSRGDAKLATQIVGAEKKHPKHAVLMRHWYKILDTAKYVTQRRNGHYSMKGTIYTHFTSPIRRYADMVVHRIVKSVLRKEQCPYRSDELQSICDTINRRFADNKKYDRECDVLKFATQLELKPLFASVIVDSVDDEKLVICVPSLRRGGGKACRAIQFNSLDVCEKPIVGENQKVRLNWKQRLYDANAFHPDARSRFQASENLSLDEKQHICRVPASAWQGIMGSISRGKKDQILADVKDIVNRAQVIQSQCREVTSEMKDSDELFCHQVSFHVDLHQSDVMKVQFVAQTFKGMLQPQLTLLNLTKQNDICMVHLRDPVGCYARLATNGVKKEYESIKEYQRTLLPILAMEAAQTSISDGDSVVVHNVPLQLTQSNRVYHGALTLPLAFCKKRSIKLIKNTKDGDEESNDYLCIRYRSQDGADGTDREVWSGHGVAFHAFVGKKNDPMEDNDVNLKFCLYSHRVAPPEAMLRSGGVKCTVDFHTKLLPHVRMEDAVQNLMSGRDLVKQIMLGKALHQHTREPVVPIRELPNSLDIATEGIRPLPRNNKEQEDAIRAALSNAFTLIQGPPGTGKTLTGVKLAYWFAKMNAKRQEGTTKDQVLYCGPSNSCIDVAMRFLKERLGNKCPKIVRMYGDTLECQIFPIPRDSLRNKSRRGRSYELIGKEEHKDVALHHLIRNSANPHSDKIKNFDKLFKRNMNKPENVKDKDIEDYQKAVTDASVHELKQYDVILCTCTASVSPRITRGCNIVQCIIDECGMCMEPESLIPMVKYNPRQVVLIGDHKQLRPIVTNNHAQELGLNVSLFERHSSRALLLREQYRMHPGICSFPSEQFYDGQLATTKLSMAWASSQINIWRDPNHPVIFCHVEGSEQKLTVSSDEGNERSFSNPAECGHVARMFSALVRNHKVNQKYITIMSQYKAQCVLIRNKLLSEGFQRPNVNTVVASQGDEWDYVILSLVRSLPRFEIDKHPSKGWTRRNMGFITDPNQINVALTRARKGLIVVGNKNLLEKDEMWKRLISHYAQCTEHGCVVNAKDFLNTNRR